MHRVREQPGSIPDLQHAGFGDSVRWLRTDRGRQDSTQRWWRRTGTVARAAHICDSGGNADHGFNPGADEGQSGLQCG